jgi:integrase
MGIAGGCRVGELVNMKIDDVDDRGNVLVVTLPDTKTNKPRYVHDNQ